MATGWLKHRVDGTNKFGIGRSPLSRTVWSVFRLSIAGILIESSPQRCS